MENARAENLLSHRELLIAWTLRTIKARYQQSILGGLWAIVQPAATAIIFSIIFTRFLTVDTDGVPYIVFSYTAMVPWTLFSGAIVDMVDSLVINMNLISKIYFPREVLPLAAVLARLLDFVIAAATLGLLMTYYQIPVFLPGLLYLPLILATQLVFSLGLGLAGAALNVFYRDVRHLVVLGLQVWLYASPVIYPVSAVPEQLRPFYFLNPMAGIIEAYRAVLLNQQAPGTSFLIAVVSALVVFVLGYWLFKRVEFQFADVV